MVHATSSVRAEAYGSSEMPNLESSLSGVTWSAIFAGAVAAASLSLILFALGSGLGFSSVSPWSNAGATATAVGIGAGVWFLIVQWLSSAAGGYMAGRLRAKWAAHESDEVFFRDTAHGFLAWGMATLLVAGILTSAVGVLGAGASVAAGAAAGTEAADSDRSQPMVDTLFRSTNPDPTAPAADARGEAGRILTRSVAGELDPADRTYLAQTVAARTGISQDEAEKRVDTVVAQGKEAADTARKAAAAVSLMTALSLMIGAFIAAVAGALGGRHRDML